MVNLKTRNAQGNDAHIIRCVKKDERVKDIVVGELGTVSIDRTAINTWYRIQFHATSLRAETATHYREPEFREFFEFVPDYDARINQVKRQVALSQQQAEYLRGEAERHERAVVRLQAELTEAEADKFAYEAKWGKV